MTDTLAGLVKSYRSTASLSVEALAARAGVSPRAIGDMESGAASSPRAIDVLSIAEALGLNETERARLRAALPRRSPLCPPDAPAYHEVPPLVSLFGRDDDLTAIAAVFRRDDIRLVTLVGPPGVGKTSLALSASLGSSRSVADGVVFVPLAGVRDPDRVPAEIGAQLGIREHAVAAVDEAVIERLGAGRRLLVLDNFEQLDAAAAWIGKLLAACPQLRILVTSRAMLHVRGERVYAVRQLSTRAATALFVERAQAIKPDFALTAATSEVVTGIVTRLEGLPLAIELAAPALAHLPSDALEQLERRLPLVADGRVEAPQREPVAHAAIAWSLDRLSAGEQRLFARLGVFNGGATIEAAQAVTLDDGKRAILAQLATLNQSGLLTVTDEDGEPRLTLLEPLREFARESLAASADLEIAQHRHAYYFLAFAEACDAGIDGPDQAGWLLRLEREIPNVRTALEWALRTATLDLGLRLAAALGRFWTLRGDVSEGRAWLDALLTAMPATRETVSPATRARALQANGQLLNVAGDLRAALSLCDEALQLARQAGDERIVGAALNSRGSAQFKLGEYAAARATHEEALAVRRALGDAAGVGSSLESLATVLSAAGELHEAIAYCEESVAILRRSANTASIPPSLSKLGTCLQQAGEYERARALFEECLELQRALEDKANMAYSYYFLGTLARQQGHLDAARERLRAALGSPATAGNRSLMADILLALGEVHADEGKACEAARLFGAADVLRSTSNSPLRPHEYAAYDASLSAIRAVLDEATFDREWRLGATTPRTQLIAAELAALAV